MMGQKPDARITPQIGRELCQRSGSAADLEGAIGQIGSQYLLTLRAVNCATGETLASTEVQAGDKNHILDALGKAASEMRNKLGESLSTLQKFDTPLDQASTPSLEALKAFSAGRKVLNVTGDAAAIPFFKRAINLDPKFAMAYAWLGLALTTVGESSNAAEFAQKAYDLRDRTSDAEKYFIAARYHKNVTGNMEKAIEACKLWIQAYPHADMPHVLLAGAIYPAVGQYDKAIEEAAEAKRLNPNNAASYAFLMLNYTYLNRPDEANAAYAQAREHKLDVALYPFALYEMAFYENNVAEMAQQVAKSAGQLGVEDQILALHSETQAYAGRLTESLQTSQQAIDSAQRAQGKEAAATYTMLSALREALLGNSALSRNS
jgi:tetratricopeptide (TPR) repeat protein